MNNKKLIKMYEDELNKSLHHEINTNFQWFGESKETEVRESNNAKLEVFKQLLKSL